MAGGTLYDFNMGLLALVNPGPQAPPYLIEFSGFVAVQGHDRLIAMFHGYPRGFAGICTAPSFYAPDNLPRGGQYPYLAGVVRSVAWGWYNPGECFNLTPETQPHATLADLLDPLRRWQLVQDVLIAAARMVHMAEQVAATPVGKPLTVPHC